MHRPIICILLALLVIPAIAEENRHDGYMFWMPCGELRIGDTASEKEFDYQKTDTGESFVVNRRETRHGIANAQIVVIQPGIKSTKPQLSVDGTPVSKLGLITFIPRELTDGKEKVKIEVTAPSGSRYLFYYTDDADKLGISLTDSSDLAATDGLTALKTAYLAGLTFFWQGKYEQAGVEFKNGSQLADKISRPEAARLFRRFARWSDANIHFGKITSGEGFYNLGLYSMVNGFWDLAYDCFIRATELMPDNPDAWYMLGDAASYKLSDLDMKMEKIYPYYQKAADLYPKENSNKWRNHVAFFRNFRLVDGDPPVEQVRHIRDEQIEYIKKIWEWCAAIMAASSRGAFRMENTYKVYDQEFDNTQGWDPKPYMGLYGPGEFDTLMKFTDWVASDCCGQDCGPWHSSSVNIGIRTWDTLLHEWNHALDWAMACPDLGIGVPCTHSSDWCGLQPIPSMGMGHHSTNRYYMTPGMYQTVRGTDPMTTPYISDWQVMGPFRLLPDASDNEVEEEAWWKRYSKITTRVTPPDIEMLTDKPVVENGYVDLKATWPTASKNTYGFAKTYIYSPKKQKVRMWIGADDNMRMWMNGRLIQKGTNYWTDVLFRNAKEKDHMAKGVMLEKGWNSIMVQITSVQRGDTWMIAPEDEKPDAWGFSVRICDMNNREVPGIKWQSNMPEGFVTPRAFVLNPKSPKTYSWDKVADDYTVLLPELTIEDLRAITGYHTMTATNEIFFDLSKEQIDPVIKPYIVEKADPDNVAVNNLLNYYFVDTEKQWFFPKEMMAIVRYKRGTQTRDLLFLRPEAYESYLKLIAVTPEAKKLGIKQHADQVIGYFLVQRDDCPNGRIVLVIDTYLGDNLPVDEEDMLDIGRLN